MLYTFRIIFPILAELHTKMGMRPQMKWKNNAMPDVGLPNHYVFPWNDVWIQLNCWNICPALCWCNLCIYILQSKARIILLLWLCQTLCWWVALSNCCFFINSACIRMYLHEYTLWCHSSSHHQMGTVAVQHSHTPNHHLFCWMTVFALEMVR